MSFYIFDIHLSFITHLLSHYHFIITITAIAVVAFVLSNYLFYLNY